MREVLSARSMNLPACDKPPAFVVDERGVADADQMQRAGLDLLEKFARALPSRPCRASGERTNR